MPDKSSRTNSVTPASDQSRKPDDDVASVEELDDEGFDDESCDDEVGKRVRFKVRGILRVIKYFCYSNAWSFFRFVWFLFLVSDENLFWTLTNIYN